MTSSHDPIRRRVVAALASLPLLGASQQSPGAGNALGNANVLIAYFSRSGNTKVVAGLLQRARQADLFEINPATAYPEDYLETVEQACQERDSNYEPPLAARARWFLRLLSTFDPTWRSVNAQRIYRQTRQSVLIAHYHDRWADGCVLDAAKRRQRCLHRNTGALAPIRARRNHGHR